MVAQLPYKGTWHNSPQHKESFAILPFFFLYPSVDRLLQLVQLSHYMKQVNPPKFYLQHLVWGFYLSSLQNGTKCKIWPNSPRSPLLVYNDLPIMLAVAGTYLWLQQKFYFLKNCKIAQGSVVVFSFMSLMQPSMGTFNSPSSRVIKDLTPFWHSNLEVYKFWDWSSPIIFFWTWWILTQ